MTFKRSTLDASNIVPSVAVKGCYHCGLWKVNACRNATIG
ncbi:conserved hypothetical protein [delta proteobacterium NaphS2]|nr:conserved hypothetical protein [delta proteobacterium NaphS2]